MKRNLFIALSGLTFLISCKTSNSGEKANSQVSSELSPSGNVALGLNDVAILIPYSSVPKLYNRAPSPFDMPNPSKYAAGLEALPSDGQAFIPAFVLQSLSKTLLDDIKLRRSVKESGLGLESLNMEEAEGILAQANLRPQEYKLSGMRIDPCANYAEIKPAMKDCIHEVRVSWQHMTADRYGNVNADGSNFHSLYRLDDKTFASFVQGLKQVRATAGVAARDEALGPHPVMIEEGASSTYFGSIVGLMHRYLRASQLDSVAFHSLTARMLSEPWFRHWALTVVAVREGKAIPVEIPSQVQVPGSKDKLVQRFTLTREDRGSTTRDPWDRTDILNDMGALFKAPSPVGKTPDTLYPNPENETAASITKYKNSFLIQNPLLHTRRNTDCMSCHSAGSQQLAAKELLGENLRGEELKKVLARPAGAFTSEHFNLKPSQAENWDRDVGTKTPVLHSLLMFGYEGNSWVITTHVHNDAALSAELIKGF